MKRTARDNVGHANILAVFTFSLDLDGPVPTGYPDSRIVVTLDCGTIRLIPMDERSTAHLASQDADALRDSIQGMGSDTMDLIRAAFAASEFQAFADGIEDG